MSFVGMAQNASVSVVKEHFFEKTKIPQYIAFDAHSKLKESDLFAFINKRYKTNIEAKLIQTTKDNLGFTHTRYQQQYLGYDVLFGVLNVHSKNGEVVSVNGFVKDDFPTKQISNIYTQKQCLKVALEYVGAEAYKWENEKEEEWLKISTKNRYASYYPKGKLVWYNKNNDRKAPLVLAYEFEIYASKPLYKAKVYIDANTKEVVGENEIIHHIDFPSTANTGYSGTQTITVDFNGVTSRLREVGRGNGIETYDMQNGTAYSSAVDFSINGISWTNGTPQSYLFALDAHWGAEQVYDYYLNVHNRNSIDGNGFKLKSYIHYDVNYANAFWNGLEMTYGDGASGNTPFTSLDIVAHEITHGLTSHTADLVYSNESGALNESFSDIFGASVEWFAKPNQANWLIGDEVGTAFRSLANPNAYSKPDTYQGNYWEFGSWDNGGVHTNSSVQNYWFYLLVNGGSGTNDNNDAYNVTGIGQQKAEKIAFRTLTNYLVNSSTFAEARFYSIQSAMDLYGACSPEVTAVAKAWFAVGVGSDYTQGVSADFVANTTTNCEVPFTVHFSNLSVNGSIYTWDFGDGTTSTAISPSHTYTTVGTYNVVLETNGGACGTDIKIENNYIVIDSSIPCTDMVANSTVYKSSCSGVLYDDGGENGDYTAGQNSYAVITPNSGLPFTLNIDLLDIEQEPNCDYDVLKIYDGTSASGNLVATLCNGSSATTSVNSATGSLFLHFKSDNYVEKQGFKVSWDCNASGNTVISESVCSGTRADSGGEIGDYDNNENSIVIIEPTGATQVSLTFLSFDVEQEANCNYDYVEVYDGNSILSPLIGRYCNGTPPPSSINSTGGALLVKFFSDNTVTKSGFVYYWTCETNGVGVEEQENTSMSIYPNPVSDYLVINAKQNVKMRYQLVDMLGKTCLVQNNYTSGNQIDVSTLAKGTYFLNVYIEGKAQKRTKIIVF